MVAAYRIAGVAAGQPAAPSRATQRVQYYGVIGLRCTRHSSLIIHIIMRARDGRPPARDTARGGGGSVRQRLPRCPRGGGSCSTDAAKQNSPFASQPCGICAGHDSGSSSWRGARTTKSRATPSCALARPAPFAPGRALLQARAATHLRERTQPAEPDGHHRPGRADAGHRAGSHALPRQHDRDGEAVDRERRPRD